MTILAAITDWTVVTPTSTQWLAPWMLAVPLLAVLMIAGVTRKWGKASCGIALGALSVNLLLALRLFGERMGNHFPQEIAQATFPWIRLGEGYLTIEVGFLLDNLATFMLLMVSIIALLVATYAYSYMTIELKHFPTQNSFSLSRFYIYFLLFVFSMLGLILAPSLMQIYIFWELVGLCSYLLIGFWYFKESAAKACKKAFIVTKFADLAFLMGILALGYSNQTFNFVEILAQPSTMLVFGGSQTLALILVFYGAVGKSAQLPLQIWLPDAMEGPTPVSALIHAATMVAAGVYLVARMLQAYSLTPEAGLFIAYTGALTAFVAASIAVVQNDIKRVLAYSTVSQLGFMFAALGCLGLTAGTFHLFTHAFFKALLFLGSGAIIVACHNNDIWSMGGLKKLMPITHATFLIGSLALAGVPPFSGFWSKDEVLAVASAHPLIFILLAISAFMTAFYVTRMYCVTFLGDYRGSHQAGPHAGPVPPLDASTPIQPGIDALAYHKKWSEADALAHKDSELEPESLGALSEHLSHDEHTPHEVSWLMLGPLVILAFFAATLGFLGMPDEISGLFGLSNFYHHWVPGVQGVELAHFSWGVMLGSVLIAVLGIGLGLKLYAKDPIAGEDRLKEILGSELWSFLQQKWYFDHLWSWATSKLWFFWARACASIDDFMVDLAAVKTAGLTLLLGRQLQNENDGKVQSYLSLVILAVLTLLLAIGVSQSDYFLSLIQLFDIDPQSSYNSTGGPLP